MAEGRERSRIAAVVTRTTLTVLTALCLASGQWTGARTAAAQTCNDSAECTVQDACQDGVCKGTPKEDGTACRIHDPCGTFSCQDGACVPSATSPPGTICFVTEVPLPSWTC